MPDPTQKIEIVAAVQGTQQAAQELNKLSAAQEQVTGATAPVAEATQKATEATKEATEATQAQTAAGSDYIALLREIDPALGRVADAMLKGGKIAGDLATKQIDLSNIGKLGTDVFAKYAGALKLLGAGAVALYGFGKLKESIKEVGDAAERSTKQLEGLQKVADKAAGKAADTADEVIAERDKLKTRQPFTHEEGQAVRETLQKAPADVRERLAPLLTEFGGGSQFKGGGRFSASDLENLARLGFEPESEGNADFSAVRASAFLENNKPRVRAIDERQAQGREAATSAAVQEALQPDALGGGRVEFNRIVEESASQFRVSADLVGTLARERLGKEAELGKRGFGDDVVGAVRRSRDEDLLTERVKVPGEEKKRLLGPAEVGATKDVIDRLIPALDRLARSMEKGEAGQTVVNNQFARQVYPDAKAKERATVNGRLEARRRGER